MRVTRLFVFALLCFSRLAYAAALENNHYYYLQGGVSEKYLSATPTQGLTLVSHKAGWEQWQWRLVTVGHGYFVSYHGTVLTISDTAVFHAPLTERNDLRYEKAANVFEPVAGKIAIAGANGDLWDGGDRVLWHALGGAVGPNEAWTALPVESVDTTRKPDQIAVDGVFRLRSAHGTYLSSGPVSKYVGVRPVIHVSSIPSLQFDTRLAYSPARIPMRYGDKVWLIIEPAGGGFWFLQRTDGPIPLAFMNTTFGDVNAWTISDPSGRHPAGDRITFGDVVAIRNLGGLFLGCPPELTAAPYLINHSSPAAWELFTIVK